MEYKLLVENWRKFIKNEAIGDVQQKETSGQKSSKIDIKYDPTGTEKPKLETLLAAEYETFVNTLKKEVEAEGDPKFRNFLKMGIKQFDGDGKDDVITVNKEASIPVKELFPTQNQIGIADSLGWVSKNNPQRMGEIAKLGPKGEADVDGRIITANGTYIVDGHHRWSQVYFLNPEASIPTYDFNVPGLKSGKGALKLAQLAIAAEDGEIPIIHADADTDIYGKAKGDLEEIKKILDSPNIMNDAAIKSLAAAWSSPEMPKPTREQIINKVAENAKSLYDRTSKEAAKGPERKYMPQPAGTEEKPQDPLKKIDALGKGAINWNPKA